MKDILLAQYEFVKSSRQALLDFCTTVDHGMFTQEVQGFGRGGSIRSLLVHINNCYQYWTACHCLEMDRIFNQYNAFPDLESCKELFARSDEFIYRVLNTFENIMHRDITREGTTASPFKVFTHVITHEYHHKGQILSICRLLGYIPVRHGCDKVSRENELCWHQQPD